MERWIWFLGMAVFYGVLFLWFLNQVKKPDYKKNYVLVKTLQSAAFVCVSGSSSCQSGYSGFLADASGVCLLLCRRCNTCFL